MLITKATLNLCWLIYLLYWKCAAFLPFVFCGSEIETRSLMGNHNFIFTLGNYICFAWGVHAARSEIKAERSGQHMLDIQFAVCVLQVLRRRERNWQRNYCQLNVPRSWRSGSSFWYNFWGMLVGMWARHKSFRLELKILPSNIAQLKIFLGA